MLSAISWSGKAILSVVRLISMTSAGAKAQEVQWRHDYAAARREAKERQRPLVVDFGTSNCFWCKKLDVSTLRDPAIVKRLNEQFIPVKIDAERQPGLAQSLGIHSYPTLVFVAPDGRILGRHEGFVEAAHFGQQLSRVLKESAPFTRAPTSPLPQQPAARPAVTVGQGQLVVRTTAPPALPVLADQASPARELLLLAQQDYRQRLFLTCLEHCTILASTYPESPEAAEARQLALKIKNDPVIAPQLCQHLTEQLGEFYLSQAESAMRANDRQRATVCLERVLQVSPGTQKARVAQVRLDRLQNSSARQPIPPKTVRAQSP